MVLLKVKVSVAVTMVVVTMVRKWVALKVEELVDQLRMLELTMVL